MADPKITKTGATITIAEGVTPINIASAGGWLQPDGTLGYHPDTKITVIDPAQEPQTKAHQYLPYGFVVRPGRAQAL